MEYHIKLPLSFEQLLDLTLQLPKIEQKRLLKRIENEGNTFPKIEMKTVSEIKSEHYQYPSKKPQQLIGIWGNGFGKNGVFV